MLFQYSWIWHKQTQLSIKKKFGQVDKAVKGQQNNLKKLRSFVPLERWYYKNAHLYSKVCLNKNWYQIIIVTLIIIKKQIPFDKSCRKFPAVLSDILYLASGKVCSSRPSLPNFWTIFSDPALAPEHIFWLKK